jgi:Methyltransferase domain
MRMETGAPDDRSQREIPAEPARDVDLAYKHYWKRKQLLAGELPDFPVRRWWREAGLSEIERIYFETISDAPSLLDVGAGSLKAMGKLRDAGYRGEYHTQDIGSEYSYDYESLDEIQRTYGAILCFDVLEHLPLHDGLAMIKRLVDLLDLGGVLIIQTPNARCVRHPLAWDMTHLHCYNVVDLWAHLTTLGLEAGGYRIVFGRAPRSPIGKLRFAMGAYFVTRWLGCDYADNIAVIARKPPNPPNP